ncbi:MAG: sigma-70 family RNA polymerase sigma factor [Bradyrhizobium sp.]|uniref:RNA polymerase sigma factor n=1 Tax=Bradyrhizobium sp. TaxID=376 RepID=UPI0025C22236|nr:sigma-70 family RNA polymerase sigma factor [Bradyrhizobium sp.]MBI5260966.1 sigma-70 family RNA polymerase sigma factor [Bradyrhizobium sp.]
MDFKSDAVRLSSCATEVSGGSVTARTDQDAELLEAALRGEAAAAANLTRALADLAWAACLRVTRGGADTEAAFREVMAALRADSFARLKGFDGRARMRVYAALVVRDLLSERVVKLLALNADTGWRSFEAFFAEDIRRIIQRNLPGKDHQQNREDAYQAVCEALLKNDLQKLRAYSGRGSPSGFILQVVENLVVDYVRTIVPRRRLPASIQRLSTLDQSVFRLLYWERLAPDHRILLPHIPRSEIEPTAAEVNEAMSRVRSALPPGYSSESYGPDRMVDISAADESVVAGGTSDWAEPTPEDRLIEGQGANLLEQAVAVLQQALPRLNANERLYLQYALHGYPAREIARLAGLPVETVHKLAQRVKKTLREEISETDAVKKWRLSV